MPARLDFRSRHLGPVGSDREEMLKETGWGLMAYYRKINRRRRDTVPRYFDDDTDKNHFPAFAAVREIAQYHVSGAYLAAPAQTVVGSGDKA